MGTVILASLALHIVLAVLAGCWIVSRAPRHAPPGPATVFRVFSATAPAARAAQSEEAPPGGGAVPIAASVPTPAPAPAPVIVPPVVPAAPTATAPPTPISVAVATPGSPAQESAPVGNGDATGTDAGTGGGFSFFGLDGGTGPGRTVIALDVSHSMFVRQPGAFDRIVAETLRAIDGLDARASFDLIVFEDGALAWRPEVVPPTGANRRDAKAWLENVARQGPRFSPRAGKGTVLFEGGGSRGDTALRQAFSLRPDRVIVLTDGQWHENPLSGGQHLIGTAELTALGAALQQARQADGKGPARIDVIFLSTARTAPGESAATQALAGDNGGQWIEVKAADLAPP